MSPNEYQVEAMRVASPECADLTFVGLGLAGEAGEVVDLIKKYLYHGHPLDQMKLVWELGDVLWYTALAAVLLNTTLEDIMVENLRKLHARYPHGFSTERSLNRGEE